MTKPSKPPHLSLSLLAPIPVLVQTVCSLHSLADSAGPGHRPSALSEHLARREMHVYSPKHRVLFFSKVARRCPGRRELLFRARLLVTLGRGQGAQVWSPISLSKSLQGWERGAVGVGSWTRMETRRRQFSQKAIKPLWEASGTTATFCTFPLGRLRRGGGESLRLCGAAHSRRAAPSGTGSSMGSPGIDIVGPKVQGSPSSLPTALDPSPAARRGRSGWQESLEQAQGSPVAPRCLGALPMGSDAPEEVMKLHSIHRRRAPG